MNTTDMLNATLHALSALGGKPRLGAPHAPEYIGHVESDAGTFEVFYRVLDEGSAWNHHDAAYGAELDVLRVCIGGIGHPLRDFSEGFQTRCWEACEAAEECRIFERGCDL